MMECGNNSSIVAPQRRGVDHVDSRSVAVDDGREERAADDCTLLVLLEQEVGDQCVGALHGELVADRRGHVDGGGVDSSASKALVDGRARWLRR